MNDKTKSERGTLLVGSLSSDDEDRVNDFRDAVRNSAGCDSPESVWYHDAVVGAYSNAGDGTWDVSSIYDVQMVLTAIEENPALLPVVEDDIEHLLLRLEHFGCSFRPMWHCVREKLTRKKALIASSTNGDRAA